MDSRNEMLYISFILLSLYYDALTDMFNQYLRFCFTYGLFFNFFPLIMSIKFQGTLHLKTRIHLCRFCLFLHCTQNNRIVKSWKLILPYSIYRIGKVCIFYRNKNSFIDLYTFYRCRFIFQSGC